MGIVMKKMVLFATALAMVCGFGSRGGLCVSRLSRPPPPPAFEPWDFAFGSALMNDYIFRGVTQSNHKPSVAAYFEPRYNLNKDLQAVHRFCRRKHLVPEPRGRRNRYLRRYPPDRRHVRLRLRACGAICIRVAAASTRRAPGSGIPDSSANCAVSPFGNSDPVTLGLPVNGNFAKKSASFYEGYAKVNVTA
jgi:hypothetical protein